MYDLIYNMNINLCLGLVTLSLVVVVIIYLKNNMELARGFAPTLIWA